MKVPQPSAKACRPKMYNNITFMYQPSCLARKQRVALFNTLQVPPVQNQGSQTKQIRSESDTLDPKYVTVNDTNEINSSVPFTHDVI